MPFPLHEGDFYDCICSYKRFPFLIITQILCLCHCLPATMGTTTRSIYPLVSPINHTQNAFPCIHFLNLIKNGGNCVEKFGSYKRHPSQKYIFSHMVGKKTKKNSRDIFVLFYKAISSRFSTKKSCEK